MGLTILENKESREETKVFSIGMFMDLSRDDDNVLKSVNWSHLKAYWLDATKWAITSILVECMGKMSLWYCGSVVGIGQWIIRKKLICSKQWWNYMSKEKN